MDEGSSLEDETWRFDEFVNKGRLLAVELACGGGSLRTKLAAD